jgi:hypothetical protein
MAAPNTLLPTRPLPHPHSLSAAVRAVIDSNRADGYPPNRFVGATQDGLAPNLLAVCCKLINKGETLEWLEKALQSHPTLLTLEDLVCCYGSSWGLDAATIQVACDRSAYFNQLAGHTRYA